MLEALKRHYDVTVLTWTPVDLEAINGFYGTGLRAADLRLLAVGPALRRLLDAVPMPLGLLRNSLLLRRCKRIGAASRWRRWSAPGASFSCPMAAARSK